MIKIGLDFDNTLIDYDGVFYEIALEKKLIPPQLDKTKIAVRKYLKDNGREDIFTLLQGEVYGLHINKASKAYGMMQALKILKKNSIELIIISHKTLHPYAGPKYDLHKAALGWLEKNEFFDEKCLNFKRENVFFEITIENKIKRIENAGLTYYIDDLTKILKMINSKIKRIHFNPNAEDQNIEGIINMKDWQDLPEILGI
tara:strand:+ start:153 stop:755 length:603 start_codon:yes stop_codon:yes gene_type:complete